MSLLAFVFFLSLGALLHRSHGLYDPAIVWLTVAFVVVVVEMMRSAAWLAAGRRATERLLAAAALFFCALQFRDPAVVYAVPGWESIAIRWSMGLAALLTVGVCVLTLLPYGTDGIARAGTALAFAAIAAIVGAEILVPRASPKPWIDVWMSSTAAVDYLRAGLNPYAQRYVDIYHGRYAYSPGFFYPPGLLLWMVPFRLLLHDVRFALIAANWISAAAFFWWARSARTRDLVPILSALVWLSFPVANFVIEQSWTDTALIPPALLMFLAMRRAQTTASSVWMGVFVVMKQYAFVAAGLALLALWKSLGERRTLQAFAIAATISILIIIPFVVADPRAMFRMIVASETDQPIRIDALNFTAHLANRFGWAMPAAGRIALTLVGGALGALTVWRSRPPAAVAAVRASFIAYGFAFLFGKWAFCNYYFFLASFLLLSLVAPSELSECPRASHEPS